MITMNLIELNPWWTEKEIRKAFLPPTYRNMFFSVFKEKNKTQVQIIIGLRRVGKSTILFQVMEHLLKEGINPLHLLYCTFDEPEFQEKRIEDILKIYTATTGIDYKQEKIYLFLDEIQKSKEWVASIKLIYDNIKNIKIFISGSASLNIFTEAKKSLAGRAIYYELKPLSFREFLHLKQINIKQEELLLYEDTLKTEFNNYLLRPFPELIIENDALFIKNYIRTSIIEPIILKDIPKEFKDVDILLLEKLVTIFFSNSGQYLKLDELAKELGRAKSTLYKALFYLNFSFLINIVLNYRPSIRASSKKLSRVYPYHPALAFPYNISEEKYAENLVMFELETKHYWRDNQKEIDFLKDNIPIEVKFKSVIKTEDTKWINYFIKKYSNIGFKKAYIITKDASGQIDDITLIPLWKFCFSGLK